MKPQFEDLKNNIEDFIKSYNTFFESIRFGINSITIFRNELTKELNRIIKDIDFDFFSVSITLFKCGWISTKFLLSLKDISQLPISKFKDSKIIDNTIIQSFQKNNYENLESMVARWKSDSNFKLIYDDMIYILTLIKNNSSKISKVIIPFMLIQIEYINIKCLESIQNYFKKNDKKDTTFDKWNWLNILEKDYNNKAAPLLIQKVLFANLNNNKGIENREYIFKKYNNKNHFAFFNRHLIMHGKIRSYASFKNLLRLFLVLDLLFDISNNITTGDFFKNLK